MPGLLMGLLQIGWFAVGTFFATKFILSALGMNNDPGTATFTIIAVSWGYVMAYIGAKGIQYVARVALYLNIVAFLMVLIVFAKTAGGVGQYTPPTVDNFAAFTFLIQAVIGFFAMIRNPDFNIATRSRFESTLASVAALSWRSVLTRNDE